MTESPSTSNIADFRQRYSGVYGWLNPKDKRSPVYVKKVDAIRVTFTDVSGAEYYANVNAGVDFEFLPVDKAWHRNPKGMFLVSRIPARQWKRGVCADNTSIREVVETTLYNSLATVSWNEAVFAIMMYPTNYVKEVDHLLAGRNTSAPLSRHFAVVGKEVWFFNLRVGTYNSVSKTITLENSMLYQELVDLCHRNNYPIEVKINA